MITFTGLLSLYTNVVFTEKSTLLSTYLLMLVSLVNSFIVNFNGIAVNILAITFTKLFCLASNIIFTQKSTLLSTYLQMLGPLLNSFIVNFVVIAVNTIITMS